MKGIHRMPFIFAYEATVLTRGFSHSEKPEFAAQRGTLMNAPANSMVPSPVSRTKNPGFLTRIFLCP